MPRKTRVKRPHSLDEGVESPIVETRSSSTVPQKELAKQRKQLEAFEKYKEQAK